jgi:ketopantoate hydroxymethyltransferase
MLGLIGKPPRPFSKLYVNLGEQMQQAFQAFKAEVNTHAFPTSVHCASIDESTVQALTDRLGPALSTPKR